MKLLTPLEALDIHTEAKGIIYNSPYIRLGQAIYNLLPLEIYDHFTNTENDIFYCTDDDRSTNVLFGAFVNKEQS